jgi:acetyl esterase/lipase
MDIMFEVQMTADLVFGRAKDVDGNIRNLTMDLYQPRDDSLANRPAVIWVHGGGFASGDKTDSGPMAELAGRGYVVASINYRIRPGLYIDISRQDDADALGALGDACDDVRTAELWLRANAARLGIDPERIAMAGQSAGAILSLSASLPWIRLVVSVSGAAKPQGVSPDSPPTIFYHGDADARIPIGYARATCAALASAGVWAELLAFPGVGHSLPMSIWLPSAIPELYDRVAAAP